MVKLRGEYPDEAIPYQQYDDDGVLVLNGVERNADKEYYRAGYDPQDRPIDPSGNSFNPHAGNPAPVDGNCNAPLKSSAERYGSTRFCTRTDPDNHPLGYCHLHKDYRPTHAIMDPRELLQHGLFTESLENFYKHIPPRKRVYIWAVFTDLVEQSIFEFQTETNAVFIDCSDDESMREQFPVDENDKLELHVAQPTVQVDRALSLWLAAIDRTKMLNATLEVTADGLSTSETSHAQLDEQGQFVTIEEKSEHSLNLPLSRLSRDIQELLAYGGVGVDEAGDDTPSQVVEIYDDPLAEDSFTFDQAADISQ